MPHANENIFSDLFDVIASRRGADAGSSYTAKLMAGGVEKINRKIREEAEEVCEAAGEDGREHLIYEICDLLYHTFVLAGYREITLTDIQAELARRFGTSGLDEKAQRNETTE